MTVLTPAIRVLDELGVPYRLRTYEAAEHTAPAVAHALGIEPGRVFKTLLVALSGLAAEAGPEVAAGSEAAAGLRATRYGLFLVPGDLALDLRRAAKAAGAKRAELARREDVPRVTGYVPGGVSPFGTRRPLPAWVDRRALDFAEISVSAGRRGAQIWIAPAELLRAARAQVAELVATATDPPR